MAGKYYWSDSSKGWEEDHMAYGMLASEDDFCAVAASLDLRERNRPLLPLDGEVFWRAYAHDRPWRSLDSHTRMCLAP